MRKLRYACFLIALAMIPFLQGCGSNSPSDVVNGNLTKTNSDGSNSPSEVVKRTLTKANAARYSEASESFISNLQKLDALTKMSHWDGITRKGTIKEVFIRKENVRGEGATVACTITFNDGLSVDCEEPMVKENGSWRGSFAIIRDQIQQKEGEMRILKQKAVQEPVDKADLREMKERIRNFRDEVIEAPKPAIKEEDVIDPALEVPVKLKALEVPVKLKVQDKEK